MARLTFLGAARTVTGSEYLLETSGGRVLIDCGMFQGDKALRLRNWAEPPFDPGSIKVLVLTHTHLDHIGRVPRLVKQGFRGRIISTPATRELAEILLKDAAHLQQEDAEYLNRKGLTKHEPALPLFDDADVDASLRLFETVPLGTTCDLVEGVSFSFRDAGHLLGAASADIRIREATRELRLLMSGDVGRFDAVLTKDPELAPEADYLVVESTYGNRSHGSVPILDQLEGVLRRTFARGGVLLVPAFAVGRAQQMIYLMDELVTAGRLRPFPIHLDSPMAVDATRIYSQFPDAHRVSIGGFGGRSLLYGKWVHLHRTRAESEALNSMKGPAVIISSSGMLTGGRILHHCRVRLPHPENTLLITGYQAVGTLGRALLDHARVVRIHKGEVPVLAEVTDLKGMSGHADAGEMLRWLSAVKVPPKTIFVTHGETEAADALAARITRERGFATRVPALGETADLSMPAVVCDIDGVVLGDNRPLHGAPEFTRRLVRDGIPFLFLTNFPSQTPADLRNRFLGAGLDVPAEHFYTSAMATIEFLRDQAGDARRVYVIGEGALVHALYEAGFVQSDTEADFVVLGETQSYHFDMIQRAALLIKQGARFIATNPDVAGPLGRPSCGALAAPIERITGRAPFYVGKPNAVMMRAALRHMKAHSEEAWMIGDNMDTDIMAGIQAGMRTILVLTGVSQVADLPRYAYRPHHVVRDVSEVLPLIDGLSAA